MNNEKAIMFLAEKIGYVLGAIQYNKALGILSVDKRLDSKVNEIEKYIKNFMIEFKIISEVNNDETK